MSKRISWQDSSVRILSSISQQARNKSCSLRQSVLAISQHSDVVGGITGGDQDSHIHRFPVRGPREAVPLLLLLDGYFL